MAQNTGKEIIKAYPRKSFFTDMLTRDITLEGCILDFVDNSVNWIIADSGKDVTEIFIRWEKTTVFSKYKIDITYDPKIKQFSIVDNGSGITIDRLKEYVFRFGSDKNEVASRTKKWLSVYWVWMKRTIFKLGRYAKLYTWTNETYSYLEWDIDKWMEQDDLNWNIEFTATKNTTSRKWTEIKVSRLNSDVTAILDNPTFFNKLRRKLELSYSLFIECGRKIILNWVELSINLPKMVSDKEINFWFLRKEFSKNDPQRREYTIITGLASKSNYEDLGWNVFCNGRMVLHADKTFLTWRGTYLRQFHNSLSPFVWNVFFTSNDATDLPWNTTKDWINFESQLYQKALLDMEKSADPVIKYLAWRYKKDSTISEIEKDETEFDKKETRTISEILKTENKEIKFKWPAKKERAESKQTRISYLIDKTQLEKVKNVLIEKEVLDEEEIDNSMIWKETFNYFFKREC